MNDFDFSNPDDSEAGDSPIGKDGKRKRLPPLTGHSRPYVHDLCDTTTVVSGGDYAHICNPFWPCTSTYCCGCGGFVSLSSVFWRDTGEPVSEFRSRMMSLTPLYIKLWVFLFGFIPGALLGAPVGAGLAFIKNPGGLITWIAVGAVIGSVSVYFIGLIVLFSIGGIGYTRTR
jgi:hypothetical protein